MNGVAEALLQDLLAQATTQTQLLQRLARSFSPTTGGGGGGSASAATAGLNSVAAAATPTSLAFKAITSVMGILGSIVGSTVKAFTGLVKGIEEFAKKSVTSGARFSDFFGIFENLPFAGPFFGFVKGLQAAVESIMDSWKAVSQVGAGFNGSFSQFRLSAVAAGLTLDEYKNVITKNANALAFFGGTTERGAAALGRMNRQFMTGAEGTGRSILSLGVSFEEGAGFLASYMGQMSKFGLSQTMSQDQMIKSAQKYVFELDAMAKILGITREEADKRAREIADDASLQAFLSGLPEAQREMYSGFLQTMNQIAPESKAQLTQLIMGMSGPVGDFGDIIALAGEGQLLSADYLKQTIERAGSGQEAAIMIAERLGSSFARVSRDIGPLATQFPALNNGLTSLANRTRVEGKSLGDILKQIGADQLAAQKEGEEAQKRELEMRNMSNRFLDIFLGIMRVLSPPLQTLGLTILNWVEKLAPTITEKIGAFAGWLNETLLVFKDKGWKEGFKKLWEDAGSGLKGVWDTIKPYASAAFEKISDIFRNLFLKVMDDVWNAIIFKISGGVFGESTQVRDLREKRDSIKEEADVLLSKLEGMAEGSEKTLARQEHKKLVEEWHNLNNQVTQAARDNAGWFVGLTNRLDPTQYLGNSQENPPVQKHSGTIGTTGSWWEKQDVVAEIQAGESVVTQSQLAQIVNTAGQSGLAAQVERLNSLTAEMLHYLKETAENTARTHRAAASLNGNLLAG